MIIALDWDGVCTDEPKGFATFINTMRSLGHKVYIVTMRYPSECLCDKEMCKWAHGVDGVVATKRKAKRAVTELLGLKVQVWIDDHPKAIDFNAKDIWGTPTPEGDVHTIDHATGKKTVIELTTDVGEEYQRMMQSKLMFVENPQSVPVPVEITA